MPPKASPSKRKATRPVDSVEDSPSTSRPPKRAKQKPNDPKQDDPSLSVSTPKARARKPTNKGKGKESLVWPEYFEDLFKVYKALNTVIAFCSSRQYMAITFSVVRSSVESFMKKPLGMNRVAEIKALLPDLVRFAYIPSAELRVHSDRTGSAKDPSGRRGKIGREASPDLYANTAQAPGANPESDQVLVLDFIDPQRTKKKELTEGIQAYSFPPPLTPDAVKKLIEKRNERFAQAVDELILACKENPQSEDPVALLMNAAKDHIPVDPSSPSQAIKSDHQINEIPTPISRISIVDMLAEIEASDTYRDQIVGRRTFEAKEATFGTLHEPLSDAIRNALQSSRGVTGFYSHQAAAINAIDDGEHVIVSTGTASGKSIIYQVPTLKFLEADPDSTAIFIYPTKALAQDQKAALEHLLCRCAGLDHIQVATYDGDTPKEERPNIRETASIIFTNFDMLHASILPHEDAWRKFFKNLKLVVVDELHYYSGLLGSHVALVMRRFRRVCAAVGNRRSRFISCSATVSNPLEHMKGIFGVENATVITEDGSPSGQKEFLVWNPPLIDLLNEKGGRISAINEACALFCELMKRGVRAIVFCKIRKICELVMKATRAALAADGRNDILSRVRAYRGGYSQQDRREIEKEAFSGKLLGIVATNALELGVDIGTLDAVIILGFPFSVASLRQQAGRAGRRARDSLAVLVCDSLPLDQHFAKNPEEVFDKPMADLVVDLENLVILDGHLQCAADEMPLAPESDSQYFGPLCKTVCETRLVKDKEGWYHTNPSYKPHPAAHVSIRGSSEVKYTILDVTDVDKPQGKARILEEIETSRALFEAYEGAIFMHQGHTFLVREVSHDERSAKIVRTDVSWVTKPRDFTNTDPIQTLRIRQIRRSPVRAYYGRVFICTIIFGFFKLRNNVILDVVDLETPPYERETTGFWIDLPKHILDLMNRHNINPAEGIHAAAHAVMNLTPLFAIASGGDIRTECKAAEKEYKVQPSQRKRPARLIFCDASGQSSGVCAKAFDRVSDLLHEALGRLESCECGDGCPQCAKSTACSEGNVVLSKLGAIIVLRGILDLHVDETSIPSPDPESPVYPETVVVAHEVRHDPGVVVELETAENQ